MNHFRELTLVSKIFFLCLSCISCHSRIEKESSNDSYNNFQSTEIEKFNKFIIQFERDSLFQNERIKFPLRNAFFDYEEGDTSIRFIIQSEWKFSDLSKLPSNYIKMSAKVSETKINYTIQIVDTGVSVIYIFELKENKWFLTEIIDEST